MRLEATMSGQLTAVCASSPLPSRLRAHSTPSVTAISIFFGSQPRNAHVPPKGGLSKLATRQPALAVIRATPFPPVPPPITIRSKLFVSLILSSSGPSPVLARSEEHTSELQSLMRISYAVFALKKKNSTRPERTRLHSKHD